LAQIKRIDHIAVLVDNLETAAGFWRDALGIELADTLDVPAEMAQIAFLPVGGCEIELVKPTCDDSALMRYLDKRGPGMHHICLEVDDIAGMIARLQEHGVQMINAEPGCSADGKKYAFVHPKSAGGVLVELYELPALPQKGEGSRLEAQENPPF
jgi:methylmalonyl-CoA/ethylmalonyl-CoA epimerase